MADAAKRNQRQSHKNRIRRLLALANHPDTPIAEKENALARAGALMLKYEIEEADLHTGDQPEEEIVLYDHAVTGRGGHGRQRAWALGAVAKGMGCEVAYRNNDAGNRLRWVRIVGPAATIENLKILLPAVLLQMETAAAKAARAHAAALPGWLTPHERATETATIRRSFMRGFGQGINDKLRQARGEYADQLHAEAASGDATSAGRELVLIGREQRVAAEFKRLFPKLGKARRPKHFDRGAYRDGVDAGRRADIGQDKINESSRPELH